jgi:hypothetical protein
MSNEFRLHHGSATTDKAVQAAGRVESIVGEAINGNRRAWGRIDVEDVALLVQHARDAAASPDWLSRMAINTLSARSEAITTERDAAVAEVARLRAVIDEAAAALPLHPEEAYLTPPEGDAEAVRQTLLAALRGEA